MADRLGPLLADFRAGRRAALARAMSIVEDGRPEYDALLAALHPSIGRGRRIGLTGPPGAGKSTLTTRLAAHYREQGLTVCIIAVDPNYIPYGTRMYVPGYGVGIAADTGGGIRGAHIDICFDDDEPITWDSRTVQIYFLAPAPPADKIRHLLNP